MILNLDDLVNLIPGSSKSDIVSRFTKRENVYRDKNNLITKKNNLND